MGRLRERAGRIVNRIAVAGGALWLGACAAEPEVFTTDLTRQQGLYVVGYTSDEAVRAAVEDRLVRALEARDFVAFPSHRDVPVLAASSAEEMLEAADRRAVVGLVLVNRALADGEPGPVTAPERITPLHPGLQAWYAQSRDEMDDPPAEGKAVFAEVNLFLVDGPRTRLFWSGTTWSFEQDGRGGAIEGITATIAEQMDRARSTLRRGG